MFQTLAGEFEQPPFHIHCRSILVPWIPGMVNEQRDLANAELQNRPVKQRRIGPGGEVGASLPPPSRENPPTGPGWRG